MNFDFDLMLDRTNTNSLKWDTQEGELPMWVADMDFKASPQILEALQGNINHGVFGYKTVPDEWYTAVGSWWKNRHGFEFKKDWLIFSIGILPAISSIIRKLTTPGEKILVQPPVYNNFYNCIKNNGRFVKKSNLIYDDSNGYQIDFTALENDLKDPQVTLMLLCNPHNPIGKIWDKSTLERIGTLCLKHNVLVVSDEIHCDLTDPGHNYTPFASISDDFAQNSITCVAPSKTFNLAGLQSAAIVIPNPAIRHKVWRALNTDEVAEPNAFAITATIAAFTKSEQWLTDLNYYIANNKKIVIEFCKTQLPQITITPSDATYLLWLNCSQITNDTTTLCQFIRSKTGLWLLDGQRYGGNGNLFLRMNIACPKTQLLEALDRLKTAITQYQN